MYSGPPGRSEFPGGAASGVQKSRDGVPIWNGDSQYFEEFAEACLRYEQTVVKEKRYLCGPRIASELRGPAKRVLIGKPAEWLSYEGGVRHLLAALRSERGQPKVPELSNLLLQYFKGTRRQKGESMSDYVTRKAEAYTRAQQSLARYQTQQSRSTSTAGSSRYLTSRTPTGRRSSSPEGSLRSAGEGPQIASTGLRRSMEPNIMEELNEQGSLGEPWEAVEEGAETTEPVWSDSSWNHWSWDAWWGNRWDTRHWQREWKHSEPADSTEWGKETLPEILPAFVQGWFLFIDSGLDTMERNVLHAELKGEFGVREVEDALRKHWTDADLKRRDQEKGRFMMSAAVVDEDEALVGELDWDALEAEGFSAEELEAMAAEQQRAEEALALIQEGRRRLKEARGRQHAVRMARQYYPVPGSSGSTSGPRRDPYRPRPGDGRNGIKCLRCGGPHKVAVCPERSKAEIPKASQANVAESEESATFTFFTDQALTADAAFLTTTEIVDQGKAVIDCGATRTVGSVHALEQVMQENLRKQGVSRIESVDLT